MTAINFLGLPPFDELFCFAFSSTDLFKMWLQMKWLKWNIHELLCNARKKLEHKKEEKRTTTHNSINFDEIHVHSTSIRSCVSPISYNSWRYCFVVLFKQTFLAKSCSARINRNSCFVHIIVALGVMSLTSEDPHVLLLWVHHQAQLKDIFGSNQCDFHSLVMLMIWDFLQIFEKENYFFKKSTWFLLEFICF